MEYFTIGMETLRVTQSYTGTASHKKHWHNSKDYADYPIDLAGAGSNASAYFATVDMKVVAIKGKGNSMTNTIWLETVDKVITPSGKFKVFVALTHWNDNDSAIKKLKVDSIVKKGSIICYEGVDGATANHLHLVCGNADKSCGNGLIKNSNGAWVSNGYCMKPEEIFYIDKDFTKVVETKDIKFKDKPKEEPFFDSNGYFSLGDTHKNIGKICKFMHVEFSKYGEWLGLDNEDILGNYYGPVIEAYIKEFQKRAKEKGDYSGAIDGCIGPLTLKALKIYGFKE